MSNDDKKDTPPGDEYTPEGVARAIASACGIDPKLVKADLDSGVKHHGRMDHGDRPIPPSVAAFALQDRSVADQNLNRLAGIIAEVVQAIGIEVADDANLGPGPDICALGDEAVRKLKVMSGAIVLKEAQPNDAPYFSNDTDADYAWAEGYNHYRQAMLDRVEHLCGSCEPEGVFATDGSGPWDCPDCGKKASSQILVSSASSPTYQFMCREIGEGGFEPCDYARYQYCQKSAQHDTTVVQVAAHVDDAAWRVDPKKLDVIDPKCLEYAQRKRAKWANVENEGFAIEMAYQYGATIIDDDAELLVITAENMINIMAALGYDHDITPKRERADYLRMLFIESHPNWLNHHKGRWSCRNPFTNYAYPTFDTASEAVDWAINEGTQL